MDNKEIILNCIYCNNIFKNNGSATNTKQKIISIEKIFINELFCCYIIRSVCKKCDKENISMLLENPFLSSSSFILDF
ncbi:MAG: hypothetical protein QXO12_02660 [Candidatus Pacearchaeota archaeon]